MKYPTDASSRENDPSDIDINKLMLNGKAIIRNGLDDLSMSNEFFNQLALDEAKLENSLDEQTDTRAYSAIRNIYSGTLLLLKYAIAKYGKNQDEIKALIAEPRNKKLKPFLSEGKIEWRFCGGFKKNTIDVADIIARVDSLGIKFDTGKLADLRHERNDIEHKYMTGTQVETCRIVNSFLPALSELVHDELGSNFTDFFGERYSDILFKNSDIYNHFKKKCIDSWSGIFITDDVRGIILDNIVCACCNAGTIISLADEADKELNLFNDEEAGRCRCLACGNDQDVVELIELFLYRCDYYIDDYSYPLFEICHKCGRLFKSTQSDDCMWCDGLSESEI